MVESEECEDEFWFHDDWLNDGSAESGGVRTSPHTLRKKDVFHPPETSDITVVDDNDVRHSAVWIESGRGTTPREAAENGALAGYNSGVIDYSVQSRSVKLIEEGVDDIQTLVFRPTSREADLRTRFDYPDTTKQDNTVESDRTNS